MRLLLLLLAPLALAACSLLGRDGDGSADYEDVYAYTAYDADGEVAVTGTLRLVLYPSDVADEPSAIRGTWTLEARADDVGPQDGEGTLTGSYRDTIEGPTFAIDLHPDRADDNVFLHGRFLGEGEAMEGTWSHSTLLGPVAAGAFEAERTRRAPLRHVVG